MKLTEAQRRAIELMPFTITLWGGCVIAGPKRMSYATLGVLLRNKLAAVRYDCADQHWTATQAGLTLIRENDK